MKIGIFTTAYLLLVSSSVLAQEQALPPLPVPSFATLDRGTPESLADVSLGISFFDGDDPDFNGRMELYGQYLTPGGVGGYASLPLVFITDNDDSETTYGNLELGGLYVVETGSFPLILRGGLSLPTAEDEDAGFLIRYFTTWNRLGDFVSNFTDTTTLRLGASPLYRSGQFFVRADLGLDIPVDQPENQDIDPLLRLNVGGGMDLGSAAITLELVSVGTTGDVGDEDRFIHTFSVGVSGNAGSVQPYGALILPMADQWLVEVNMVLMVGLRVPFNTGM